MIKKNYISILTFLTLFTIGFIYLNKVFVSTHFYNNTIEDFKTLSKKTNIDVVFYGSSHSYTAYNPVIINNECKTISYNLGSAALRIPFTEMVFEESLKYNKPKLVILEVYEASVKLPTNKVNKGLQLRAFDFVSSFSSNKINKIYQIYENNEIISVLVPLIRNHNKWNENSFVKLDRRKKTDLYYNYYFNGFVGTTNKIKDSNSIKKYQNFKHKKITIDSTKSQITTLDSDYLNEIIKNIIKNEIEILVVSSPSLKARYNNYNYYKQLTLFCKNLNINYLNLNDYYNEIGLDFNDFNDLSHLNNFGSIKASKFISNYIKKKYLLPNRSSEMIWKSSQKEFLAYTNLAEKRAVYSKNLNKKITENIGIKNISIKRRFNTNYVTIYLDSTKPFLNTINNYKLGYHIYPKKEDYHLLSQHSKKMGWKFELRDIRLNITKNSIYLEYNSMLKNKNIDHVDLFLYHKNGRVGKTIVLNEF